MVWVLRKLSGPVALEDSFLAHRADLLRFLRARGAGDAAEELLHELWLRLAEAEVEVLTPLPYMMRAANRLMIDRHRSSVQSAARESAWQALSSEPGGASPAPLPDRVLAGRDALRRVEGVLAELGERTSAIFRRHRVDGVAQRAIAEEFGISLSTVESDLRRAYAALARLRETSDEV